MATTILTIELRVLKYSGGILERSNLWPTPIVSWGMVALVALPLQSCPWRQDWLLLSNVHVCCLNEFGIFTAIEESAAPTDGDYRGRSSELICPPRDFQSASMPPRQTDNSRGLFYGRDSFCSSSSVLHAEGVVNLEGKLPGGSH